MNLKVNKSFLGVLLLLFASSSFAEAPKANTTTTNSDQNNSSKNSFWYELWQPVTTDRPWSVMLYGGETAQQQIGKLIGFKAYDNAHEMVFSAEGAYVLYKNIWSEWQLATNIAGRFASHNEYPNVHMVPEFDAYLMGRFTAFPWNKYLYTTVAVGEGVSYATSVPYPEMYGETSKASQRFLDFMAFEATFALPSKPYLQLVARIHHRSSCFGLFCDEPQCINAGSNVVGLGIRYYL